MNQLQQDLMAARGKSVVLQIDDTQGGAFITVGSGMVYRVHHADGGKVAIAATGTFKDQMSDARVREMFFSGAVRDWRISVPDVGAIEGPFQIVALEFSAEHAGEITFDLALSSVGTPIAIQKAGEGE